MKLVYANTSFPSNSDQHLHPPVSTKTTSWIDAGAGWGSTDDWNVGEEKDGWISMPAPLLNHGGIAREAKNGQQEKKQ